LERQQRHGQKINTGTLTANGFQYIAPTRKSLNFYILSMHIAHFENMPT
jgi:hypothetical protein